MSTEHKTSSVLPSALLLAGLAAIFAGERIFGTGTFRNAGAFGGLLLVVVAVALRARQWASAQGDVR